MPVLPRLFLPFAILLFSILLTLFPRPTYAEPGGPPAPAPCANILRTDELTKVSLPPIAITLKYKAPEFQPDGSRTPAPPFKKAVQVKVDFSKIGAIFAPQSSDYWESKFPQKSHREADLLELADDPQEFNKYNGPGQKAAPQVVVDDLRAKYVKYVWENPGLIDAGYTYTDIENEGPPQTVYDLVGRFGLPTPPVGADGWGRYWQKIPTSVNQFYQAVFVIIGIKGQGEANNVGRCAPMREPVYFVLPDYFRTTSIAVQMNMMLVPKEAQTYEKPADFVDNNLLNPKKPEDLRIPLSQNILGKIVQFCLKPITDTPIAKALKKAVKITMNLLLPQNAYALSSRPTGPGGPGTEGAFWLPEGTKCPPVASPKGKEQGIGPFCSLPAGQLHPNEGEHCEDAEFWVKVWQIDSGTDIVCTFFGGWPPLPTNSKGEIIPGEPRPVMFMGDVGSQSFQWDSCESVDDDGDGAADTTDYGSAILECKVTINVYRTFYIPWLAPIWNNSTFSHKQEQTSTAVLNTEQITGRPGFSDFFKPAALDEFVFEADPDRKNLPSLRQGAEDELRQRLMGATYCAGNENVRDQSLRPNALQEILSGFDCKDQLASSQPSSGSSGGTSGDGSSGTSGDGGSSGSGAGPLGPPTSGDAGLADTCNGKYTLNNPVGNFGDSNCTFSQEALYQYLLQVDPANADKWFAIILMESGFNPLAYNPNASDPAGAWGLLQMGRGRNGPSDRGDVDWQTQIANAVAYNNLIGGSFCYWEAAIILGYAQGC